MKLEQVQIDCDAVMARLQRQLRGHLHHTHTAARVPQIKTQSSLRATRAETRAEKQTNAILNENRTAMLEKPNMNVKVIKRPSRLASAQAVPSSAL